MKNIIFLLLFISSLSANAGFFYRDLEFIAMENFAVEKKNDKVNISFDYVIKNPNWYGIVLKPSALKLTIAGVDCGWVSIDDKMKIKRKKKGSYPFVLSADAANFVQGGFASLWALLKGEGIDFNLKGKLNAGVAFYKKKWPLDYTYKMSYEEFLSFF